MAHLRSKYERTYSEASKPETFDDRLNYLWLNQKVVDLDRSIARKFYKTRKWLKTREEIRRRDLGSDLGVFGQYIYGDIYVHHINPITTKDILTDSPVLYDPENLICCSLETHNTIHYSPAPKIPYVERKPGDTKLW